MNYRLAMAETRACARCGTSLPSGVPDVFCPACALRGALAGDRQRGVKVRLIRWLQRLRSRKQEDKSSEKPLAYHGGQSPQSEPMATVAPAPGQLIGDYEILEQIGGNMGFVFKARHLLLDKVVALKLVPADWMADPARLARFEREMRVMGQLEHPNLVTAADARRVDEWHLVAMELIDGVDLLQLVRIHGHLPVAAACEAARQAAQGLQFAHEHGLIHRDIKPSNLMLTRAGTVKVIDMGLALPRDDSTVQLTQTGIVMGTMSYCAPEQFCDASHVDIRADIYSLGCTLYHLLTGRAPYSPRKSVPEIMQAHLHEPFPSLAEACADAPVGLEAVLARMTAKDRRERFSNPGEVAAALEPFARGAELGPLVPKTTQQTPPQRATAGKLPSPAGRQRTASQEQRPRARWPRLAALLVLLIAVAGAALLLVNLRKGDPVVALMDTTAEGGVYDEENKGTGNTNAEEIKKVLQDILPRRRMTSYVLSSEWKSEETLLVRNPQLVAIHRSAIFHSYNWFFKFGRTNEGFANPTNDARWVELYKIADEMLIRLIDNIGSQAPQAKFLIYSRGTDTQWLVASNREKWVKDIEARFPKLKGRLISMLIPRGKDGSLSFRNPETQDLLRSNVTEILGLPKKRK